MTDIFRELENTLRASVLKRFPGVSEVMLKKVRVWVDEKWGGCVSTNAAFLVAKETGKSLPEVALRVAAGWVADDPRLGRVDCYLGNGAVVKIVSKVRQV
jgi:hypothetical protein